MNQPPPQARRTSALVTIPSQGAARTPLDVRGIPHAVSNRWPSARCLRARKRRTPPWQPAPLSPACPLHTHPGNAKPQLGLLYLRAKLGLGAPGEDAEEIAILQAHLDLTNQESDTSTKLKTAQERLMEKVFAKYGQLTVDDIKTLVVEDKWLSTLAAAVQGACEIRGSSALNS